MRILEAHCSRCKELFIPASPDAEDMIHGETEAGQECGGIGIIAGQWLTPSNESRLLEALTPQELHGRKDPHCEDPNCEFHHPELCQD